jgi:hypothetical protein
VRRPALLDEDAGRAAASTSPTPSRPTTICPVIHLRQDAPVYGEIVLRQFEEMLEQSVERPLVLAISLHTFIMGQPHRLQVLREIFRRITRHSNYDRVWLTTPGAIADHCIAMKPGIIPGS